jgi:hypothetical protein
LRKALDTRNLDVQYGATDAGKDDTHESFDGANCSDKKALLHVVNVAIG